MGESKYAVVCTETVHKRYCLNWVSNIAIVDDPGVEVVVVFIAGVLTADIGN